MALFSALWFRFRIDFSAVSLCLSSSDCVFFWNPSCPETSCLASVCCRLTAFSLCVWLLVPSGIFFFLLLLTFSFFYVLWLVFLCSIQVRIAPTVTTWSNKTPTALPSHPPAASPSDTQVYPSLSLFEQSSAHLNMYVVMYLLPTSLEFPTPICLSAYCILVLLGGKKQGFFFVFLFVCLFVLFLAQLELEKHQPGFYQWFKSNFTEGFFPFPVLLLFFFSPCF